MIKRVLISVSDKTGIIEFAKGLLEFNVEIVSTGGTARTLREAGLKVLDVSEITGFPEMMDGRVKTLHPAVHGALLALRKNNEHMDVIKQHNIVPIDMVVVNLYPFEKTVAKEDCSLENAIENIDIGGPSMIRSASKNFESVIVIVNPAKYKKDDTFSFSPNILHKPATLSVCSLTDWILKFLSLNRAIYIHNLSSI